MKLFFIKAAAIFFLLFMVFVPFPSIPGDVQTEITGFIFLKPVMALQGLFFDDSFTNIAFTSDTRSLNILIFLLATIAFIVAFFIKPAEKLLLHIRVAACYYLAFVLLKYGVDKIFLAQFYTPEPNILYTPYGQLSKDILYWSTMGISPLYSVITGSIEVITALLLLFGRTRALGLLLSLVVMLQIIIINFSFDISVKTFSVLLFAMAWFAAWPVIKTLYSLMVLQHAVKLKPASLTIRPYVKAGLKVFIIGLMLLQALYTHFNEEAKPVLHGAYTVKKAYMGGKALQTADFPFKSVFFHKNSYVIFQKADDAMADYHYRIDAEKRVLRLTDYPQKQMMVSYSLDDKMLTLDFDGQDLRIILQELHWEELPALQDDFHLTVDDLK